MVGRIEQNPNGTKIVHHEERRMPFRPAVTSRHFLEVHEHIERHLGAVPRVYHDKIGDLIFVDVCPVPPSRRRPWWTLVTNGVSGAPMRVPPEAEGPRLVHAELCVQLPPHWPIHGPEMLEPRWLWPLAMLSEIGRFPHALDSWIDFGVTIVNGVPEEPYLRGCRFAGAYLDRPWMLPRAFETLRARNGTEIRFLSCVPLDPEELRLGRRISPREFHDRLRAAGVGPLVDLDRPSAAR